MTAVGSATDAGKTGTVVVAQGTETTAAGKVAAKKGITVKMVDKPKGQTAEGFVSRDKKITTKATEASLRLGKDFTVTPVKVYKHKTGKEEYTGDLRVTYTPQKRKWYQANPDMPTLKEIREKLGAQPGSTSFYNPETAETHKEDAIERDTSAPGNLDRARLIKGQSVYYEYTDIGAVK